MNTISRLSIRFFLVIGTLLFGCAGVGIAMPPGPLQDINCPGPLSVNGFRALVSSKIPSPRQIERINKCGIAFQITSELEKEFRSAGASDQVIQLAKDKAPKAPKPQPPPDVPNPDAPKLQPTPPMQRGQRNPCGAKAGRAASDRITDWQTCLDTAREAPSLHATNLETLLKEIVDWKREQSLSDQETAILTDDLKMLLGVYSEPLQPLKITNLVKSFYRAFVVFPPGVVSNGDVAAEIRKYSGVVKFDVNTASDLTIDSTSNMHLDGDTELFFSPDTHHRIVTSAAGFRPKTEEFDIAAGEIKTISPNLIPETLSFFLFIESQGVEAVRPDRSRVVVMPFAKAVADLRPDQVGRLERALAARKLNAESVSLALITGIPPETPGIDLEIRKEKYKARAINVKISDHQSEIDTNAGDYIHPDVIRLEKLVGNLDISSVPSGAEVFLNGKSIGPTPRKMEYEIGDYELTIKHDETWKYNERISVKDGGTVHIEGLLKPSIVFLGIHSPNAPSSPKPLINPQEYRETQAAIQNKLTETLTNYFVEAPNDEASALAREFLLKALDTTVSSPEARSRIQTLRRTFESDLFLFGYFPDTNAFHSGDLELYLFSSFSLKPDKRNVRTDRLSEIADLFRELDRLQIKNTDLLRPYIGMTTILTTLKTKRADPSTRPDNVLVALQVQQGSPAASAGIHAGDLILKIDGKPATATAIDKWIASHSPGSVLQFDIEGSDGTERKVSVKSVEAPAVPITAGASETTLRNALLLRLKAVRLAEPRGSAVLNVIALNEALAQMDVKAWNDALESLGTFDEKAANAHVLQPAVYYYRALCFEQLGDTAGARQNFDNAVKATDKRLASPLYFDFQTLSEWRRYQLR